MSAVLSETMRTEMSGYFTQNRAAEPAADLGISHFRDGGADRFQQPAWLILDRTEVRANRSNYP